MLGLPEAAFSFNGSAKTILHVSPVLLVKLKRTQQPVSGLQLTGYLCSVCEVLVAGTCGGGGLPMDLD